LPVISRSLVDARPKVLVPVPILLYAAGEVFPIWSVPAVRISLPFNVRVPALVSELVPLKKLMLPVLVSPRVNDCLAVVASVPFAER